MNDFKFYPPGLDEGSTPERAFYVTSSPKVKAAQNPIKRHVPTLLSAARNPSSDTALNHRISMCCVVFGYEEGELKIMLLENTTGAGAKLELPGCLAAGNQTLENSAREMVHELSGSERFFIEQVYSFGNPGKGSDTGDAGHEGSNTWEITVAFFALLNADSASPSYSFTASGARWYSLQQIRDLNAYQNKIVTKALSTLRFEIRHFPIAFELLPEKFTLQQVQSLYEAISGHKLDKRNFRKKLKALNLVLPSGEKQKNIIARPSELFVFNREVYADSHNSIL